VKEGLTLRTRTLVVSGLLLIGFTTLAMMAVEARARQSSRTGLDRPRASPHESVTGTIDGADLTIVYGRPSMRGRKIMGALVPYGRWWCPGADEATELTTSKSLRAGNLVVPAGTYTLYMLPSAKDWTLMINKETGTFHTQYFPASDLGRITLQKRTLAAPVEQLTFAIEPDASGSGGVLGMRWETTEVFTPFTVVE
jgi:hypothetical protein